MRKNPVTCPIRVLCSCVGLCFISYTTCLTDTPQTLSTSRHGCVNDNRVIRVACNWNKINIKVNRKKYNYGRTVAATHNTAHNVQYRNQKPVP